MTCGGRADPPADYLRFICAQFVRGLGRSARFLGETNNQSGAYCRTRMLSCEGLFLVAPINNTFIAGESTFVTDANLSFIARNSANTFPLLLLFFIRREWIFQC